MTRTRTSSGGFINGTYHNTTGPVNNSSSYGPMYRHTCTDVVGQYPLDNTLDIEKYDVDAVFVNGQLNLANGSTRTFVNFKPPGWPNPISGSHLGTATPSESSFATEMFARTNPSRPVVDLPVLGAEMKELPSLLLATGRNVSRVIRRSGYNNNHLGEAPGALASQNLAVQFGWAPLISDLHKLSDFTGHVDRRVAELEKLNSRGGLKRAPKPKQYVNNAVQRNLTILSSGATIRCDVHTMTSVSQWATVRWIYSDVLKVRNGERYRERIKQLSRQAALGATIDYSTAWELMPWSWLIDYFTTAGDYFAAKRNLVGAKPVGMCVMTHSRTVRDYRVTTRSDWISGGELRHTYEQKRRRLYTDPTISASVPFLTGRQLSILGSLSFTRQRRGIR